MSATPPFAGLSIEPMTTVERVAEELRRSLFEGEIEPGTPLREVALAAALGVSRSTVREAFGVLVAEGLADRLPNRGTQVRRLDAAQVADVCRARLVVETAGVRRWAVADEEARDELRSALAAYAELRGSDCTTAQFVAAHLRIHRALAGLAGSARLLAFVDGLHAEVRLALAEVDRARGNAAEQVHSHSHLLDLLEAGDTEAAVAELAAHLEDAQTSMSDEVARRAT
ncbi:DNA-binding transcriptional regulator, GntR family [Nocardioides scoriae]|uniref:DNA-binding transcriptional regulator, GntR family n=1 Tax=Nocardioides scoriae TaxID=642780 RepID=A0A1H1WBS3_9ACTN|nr:GntR family transcriptional regulator [Nocardioides scoriae]SDS94525.1 DNA-binding transcriptional regulator, GntR family [Nocardioides scoriae]